jgi:hypothetical protein
MKAPARMSKTVKRPKKPTALGPDQRAEVPIPPEDTFRRLSRCHDAILESGRFSPEEASQAVVHTNPETKEAIAQWLRSELRHLRAGEKTPGRAPVIRGESLSRLVIADIAMTMLEACEAPPEDNLFCLLEELLDLDRHRAKIDSFPSDEFKMAADIEGGLAAEDKSIGVRELARLVSVQPSTITMWRRSPEYSQRAERYKSWAMTPSYKELIREFNAQKK